MKIQQSGAGGNKRGKGKKRIIRGRPEVHCNKKKGENSANATQKNEAGLKGTKRR